MREYARGSLCVGEERAVAVENEHSALKEEGLISDGALVARGEEREHSRHRTTLLISVLLFDLC